MSGYIRTPPDCNNLVGAGSVITIADVYPASLRPILSPLRATLSAGLSQIGKKPVTVTFRDEDQVVDLFLRERERIKVLTGLDL